MSARRAPRRVLGVVLAAAAAFLLTAGMVEQLAGAIDPRSSIGRLWKENREQLGTARGGERCAEGSCVQAFQHGRIYWSRATGPHIVRDDVIGQVYQGLGAEESLGLPRDQERREDNGRWQEFQRGGVFTRTSDVAIPVQGRLWAGWLRSRNDGNGLGYPLSSARRDERGVLFQEFERGTLYVRGGSALAVRGEIAAAYRRDHTLGYPVAEERLAGKGRAQRFEGGAVWWSESSGAVSVRRDVLAAYASRGGEGGELGYPLARQSEVDGGVSQSFQNGTLYRADSDGSVHAAIGDVNRRHQELGGPDGPLGLPTGERTALGNGSYQTFAGGVMVASPRGGMWAIDRTSFDAFAALPSRFGWPVRDMWADERGTHTAFEQVETIQRDGRLYSTEPVDASTAVLICDSQCDGTSWVEQGVRANGFGSVVTRAYGGGGYVAGSKALGGSVTEGLASHRILLPQGEPGLVVITLGGNDVSQRVSAGDVVAGMRRLIELVRQDYPKAQIVINGVMSRRDAAHAARRAMQETVFAEAAQLGFRTVSVAGWISDFRAPQKDEIHLSQAGHDRVAGPYADALRAVLAPR